ncbi:MAG: hypothetical protein ABIV51_01555 [Saprospiraceae bacterium]
MPLIHVVGQEVHWFGQADEVLLKKYTQMQKVGGSFLISGGILITGSAVLFSSRKKPNSDSFSVNLITEANNSLLEVVGIGLLVGGGSCIALGAPLFIVGTLKKQNLLSQKNEAILYLNSGSDGLGLALRF